jgi:hypothetical protein
VEESGLRLLSRSILGICVEGLRKITRNLSRQLCPDEIITRHLQNRSQKCYCLSNIARYTACFKIPSGISEVPEKHIYCDINKKLNHILDEEQTLLLVCYNEGSAGHRTQTQKRNGQSFLVLTVPAFQWSTVSVRLGVRLLPLTVAGFIFLKPWRCLQNHG